MIIASMIILLAYTVFAVWRVGKIPDSLSATYYLLPKQYSDMFSYAIITAGILAAPVWIGCSREGSECLAFMGATGLIFVGTAPQFKLSWEGKVHIGCTILASVAAVAWLLINGFWVLVSIAIGLLLISGFITRKWIFCAEFILFATVYTAVASY